MRKLALILYIILRKVLSKTLTVKVEYFAHPNDHEFLQMNFACFLFRKYNYFLVLLMQILYFSCFKSCKIMPIKKREIKSITNISTLTEIWNLKSLWEYFVSLLPLFQNLSKVSQFNSELYRTNKNKALMQAILSE